ncbi:hypothetical protein CV772_14820 [Listeria monocytogenes]|nr:hypothetical protein [Listeria monocytogenes]
MKFLKMLEFRLLSIRIFKKSAFYRIKLNFLLTFYRPFTGQKTRNSVVRCYCQVVENIYKCIFHLIKQGVCPSPALSVYLIRLSGIAGKWYYLV